MKKSIVIATAVAAALTSGVAAAELSANAAFTSNYIWRGVTQTNDSAAGQGGIDWGFGPGFYAGTWLSNVDFSGDLGVGYENGTGYEMDVYAGWGGETSGGGFGWDLGVITYQYPITPEFNFTEAYASGTFSIVTVGLAYTVDAASGNDGGVFDSGDMYVNGSLDFGVGKTDMSIYAGSYMYENDGKAGVGDVNYNHFGASIGKDGFTFSVDKNDIESLGSIEDNVRFSAMYSVDFEL